MKKILFILMFILTLISCTDSTQAKLGGYGDNFKIEMLNCDGTITHSWISTGKVRSESNSDGYYFLDSKSGELLEVSGNVIITRLPKTSPTVTITPVK